MSSPTSEFSSGKSFSNVIEAFERALRHGESVNLANFLDWPDNVPLLLELIHVELEFQLKRGSETSTREYITRFPQLADHPNAILGLLEAELTFRQRLDPTMDRVAFRELYPEYASAWPDSSSESSVGTRVEKPDLLDSPRLALAESATILDGRYRLIDKLGEGGMGEVWAAQQTQPVKRQVAVKLIKAGMDSRAVLQRFDQERQALAVMDHPNIAKVFDGGLTEGRRPYFVMELVAGMSLTKFCDEKKLGIHDRLHMFVEICQAVQHAHQKGIVHRDLKPSNILVSLADGKPSPKIIDFGVAKAMGEKLTDQSISTELGTVVGTLEYMSPEQADPTVTDVDTRADIYSLGVILYELLTGLRPIDRKQLRKAAFDEMIRWIREEEPSRPSTRLLTDASAPSLAAVRQIEPAKLTKLLKGDLDWLVMKCLEKQRDRRYETANSLARDVQRFLADEAVEARPPSTAYRLRKFVRRNKRTVLGASLVLLALVAGIAGATWGAIRAAKFEAQAELERRTAEIQKKTATQLTDYLVKTFQSADPVAVEAVGFHGPGERSEENLAKRMLNRGAEIVREHFQDSPAVRSTLLETMGNSYRGLGAWDDAHALLKEAFDLRMGLGGEDHPDALQCLQSLAHLARDRGQYTEADKLYRDVIARREKLYTSNHLLVAESKFYLGWMTFYRPFSIEGPQFNDARLADAEKLLLEVLRIREEKLPKNHRELGFVLAAIASVKLSRGKQEISSLSYATRAMEVFRLSDQDATLGNAMVELITAEQQRMAGKHDLAEKGYVKILGMARKHLGERHPLVVLQIGNLAGLYRKMGEMEKAEKSLVEFLKIIRTVPAFRNQSIVVDAIMQYGDEVRNRRSIQEAVALYREALLYARERPRGNEANIANLETRLAELEKKSKK